ncbi:White collar-2 protein light receptor [Podospora bellae-mahoneyi]|uniref:White collar-2 protein light receptor n=1 Tax=Podospora bellae-mahoneyi TaxID=2093777 RepID=A0ABR0FX05_9PEZI|nr:White collar-2 protein light receptor [Podospora bellae-mahoneyi]
MSHGPPPSLSGSNYFGYGTGSVSGVTMSGDPNDMMSLLDSSMFPPFDDNMSMSLDAQQPFNPSGPAAVQPSPSAGLAPSVDLPFSPDDSSSTANVGGGGGGGVGPGAGPLPVATLGSGSGGGSGGSNTTANTVTEFTKRRNWPAKVVEELQDFLHILDANGRIKHVSPSVEKLTGHKPADLLDVFLKDLIHPDDVGVFTSELNESIASGSPLRLFYRLRKSDNKYAIFESVGHAHIAAAKFAPNPNNQSPFCQAVFMMSRPYPTKNAGFLDSFLEHKIENERLKRRIAELKREEQDEVEESHRTWRQSQEGRSDITPSDADTSPFFGGGGARPTATSPLYTMSGNAAASTDMPPPNLPASASAAAAAAAAAAAVSLTREALEGMTGSNRPDSIRDKMARYEGGTHVDTIEMLTGLRYQQGERSRGITTGNASPTLVKGDAGIAIPADRDPRGGGGDKKKKLKVTEEYVCTDCGTLDSPEWRKGPNGPKTLCNACGLRWAKKEKKKNKDNSNNSNGGTGNGNNGGDHHQIENVG